MSKRVKKTKHIHTDKYKNKSDSHQAENARNQERWKHDREPLDLPAKKPQQIRRKGVAEDG